MYLKSNLYTVFLNVNLNQNQIKISNFVTFTKKNFWSLNIYNDNNRHK